MTSTVTARRFFVTLLVAWLSTISGRGSMQRVGALQKQVLGEDNGATTLLSTMTATGSFLF